MVTPGFFKTVLIAGAGLIVSIPLASAEPGERNGPRRGPPPEAFEACVDKAEDDVCTFSGGRGEVSGQCIIPPRGEEALVCAPENHRHRPDSEAERETS